MTDDAKTPMKTPMTSFSKGGGGDMPSLPAVTGGDLEQRVADLEMRPRMPASGTGDNGDALVLDGVSPRWGEGGGGSLPPGLKEDDMVVWDKVEEKWVVYAGVKNIIRWWDSSTNTWKEIEIPEDDDKVLQTITVGNLAFGFLKWR
jgi:hypothetical protein